MENLARRRLTRKNETRGERECQRLEPASRLSRPNLLINLPPSLRPQALRSVFAESGQRRKDGFRWGFSTSHRLRPFLCHIMQIPSGSNVEVVDGVFQITEEGAAMSYALPRCKANVTHPIMARALPPDYDGWLAYVGASNQRLHSSFISLPHVPT